MANYPRDEKRGVTPPNKTAKICLNPNCQVSFVTGWENQVKKYCSRGCKDAHRNLRLREERDSAIYNMYRMIMGMRNFLDKMEQFIESIDRKNNA